MTSANFNVLGIDFLVSAKMTAGGVQFPSDPKSTYEHNQFTVSVKTAAGKVSFNFYGSINDYNHSITEMDESNLKHALYCLVTDACSAKDSFADFCGELGYDEDSRTAERIYKACKKQLEKLNKICLDTDIYSLSKALNA